MSDTFKLNPFTGRLDDTGPSQATLDARYVLIAGSVLTGDLEFPSTGYIMNDGTNRWRVTINSSGAIVTTLISGSATTGQPIGLLLALTYAS